MIYDQKTNVVENPFLNIELEALNFLIVQLLLEVDNAAVGKESQVLPNHGGLLPHHLVEEAAVPAPVQVQGVQGQDLGVLGQVLRHADVKDVRLEGGSVVVDVLHSKYMDYHMRFIEICFTMENNYFQPSIFLRLRSRIA
jgi:hypothetical protein